MNSIELLKQYKELLDEGIITQEEFETKRNEILAEMTKANQLNASNEAQNNATVKSAAQSTAASDGDTFGWAVLGFLIPFVGLILFIVWADSAPAKSRSAGKGALIGVIVVIISWIIIYATGFSYYY